ncbi:hypothetical protein RB195_001276 [Necator americanus]|uniref:Uncharacterized protein n=1 Tax=Necator americanus TaxID=51031 RepID=A0ABR1DEC6_NECAM
MRQKGDWWSWRSRQHGYIGLKNSEFEQLAIRIGRLRMRKCGLTPALTIFVAYTPTSSYEEEVEAFYMDLEKFI